MNHLGSSWLASVLIMTLATSGCGSGASDAPSPPSAGGSAGAAGHAGEGGSSGGASGAAGASCQGGVGGGASVDADNDGYESSVDCNDGDPAVHPGAAETCNGIDDNCDGKKDEGVTSTWYVDADGDGHGVDVQGTTVQACSGPNGYAAKGGDCDDTAAGVFPGAPETCNGVDDNCDGKVDEGLSTHTCYLDADGDGYGVDAPATNVTACGPPAGYADAAGDCDDGDASAHPGGTESCNFVDDNCNGSVDEGVLQTFYADGDGDGFGVDNASTNHLGCSQLVGLAAVAGDCDNTNPAVYPGASEVCDGLDNNCDGTIDEGVPTSTWYPDNDHDGYGALSGAVQTCSSPGPDWSANTGDCADNDADQFPGNVEVCDGKDNDCDPGTAEPGTTTYYRDADGDGYGTATITVIACLLPPGYSSNNMDCDDGKAAINPGAIELCDGIDNNCVNGIDEGPVETWPDADKDGYGDGTQPSKFLCAANAERVSNSLDCNDADKTINPLATEIPGNGIDENCDGGDTTSGTVCGADNYGITALPAFQAGLSIDATDNAAGNPRGATYYWDDFEISTTAGNTFTMLMHARTPATLRPYMYYKANACGTTGFTGAATWYSGHPVYPYHRGRQVVTNSVAGYYYQVLTTTTAGQTGAYDYEVIPGDLGHSCGANPDNGVWPLGWRETGALATTDTQTAPHPVPAGYAADDYEFYLRGGSPYTLLYGGATYTERMYLTAAGACGTAIATSSAGITNGGARILTTPATDGIYAAFLSATATTAAGTYTFNVVPGNVGESCFAGAGGTAGTGDSYVLYPLGGSVTQTLASGDRMDTFLGTRYFDDYETWLEAGQSVTIRMTSTTGFVPRLRLTSASACTTILATSAQLSGTLATITYTPATSGIYVILATSYSTSQTGTYTLSGLYN